MVKREFLLSCNDGVIKRAVLCLCVSLVGCSIAFDAPPNAKDIGLETSAKLIDDLKSAGDNVKERVEAVIQDSKGETYIVGEAATDDIATSVIGVNDMKNRGLRNDDQSFSAAPSLSFERLVADMPQLAVNKGMEKAIISVDGERVGLGEITKSGVRIGLIATGHHELRVECPFDPPFSAKFYVQKGDRMVLRGKCSTAKKTAENVSPSSAKSNNANIQQTKEVQTALQGKTILLFSRDNEDAIRLLVRGIPNPDVQLDGEKIKWNISAGEKSITIQPGRHSLKVLSQPESPFSADFFVEKGDIVTLCGDCVSAPTPVVAEAVVATQAPKKKAPAVLSFSKIGSGPPQLSIHAMGNAVIILDGKKIGTEGVLGVDRFVTIQPGYHTLEATLPGDMPFKASFYIEAGERATLRGVVNTATPK